MVAGAFDHRNVQEGVGRAVGRLHEAEALRRIEPFDHRGDIVMGDLLLIVILIVGHDTATPVPPLAVSRLWFRL
jgi:hypothetical protein